MIGKILAHYEVTAMLGKGGMGEVYRATDTKLDRDVAIKVLPVELSGDPERTARFDREARTLASLQHPNVASIYGFEEVDGTRFLVMELVEGSDLASVIESGALSLEDTVRIARQIATGLEAAHERGIVHRDLKPANIMVTGEGEAKILDFGLARAWYGDPTDETSLENSPTITAAMTQAGTILGTAAYMSPEQARGRNVDSKADIWAYGVILWEMMTGRRLFEGETISDTLASVLRSEILWDQLPKHTPPTIRRILERCLTRDPSRRLQAIAEARIALTDLADGESDESQPPVATRSPSRFARERLAWIGMVVVLLAAFGAQSFLRSGSPEQPMILSTLLPPADCDFGPATPFAVSPDGSRVAFVAISSPGDKGVVRESNGIWIRELSEAQPRRLVDVDGESYPFWSPDGRWIGFFANGHLNKIEADGGPVVPLCDAGDGRGGSWSDAGVIIFQRNWAESLMQIPSGGGTPTPLTTLNKERQEIAHRWPTFLPDGQHFLFYLVSTSNPSASEYSGIYIGSLDGSEPQLLLKSDSRALYVQGHLLYRAGTTLMAQSLDLPNLQLISDAVPIATDIPGGGISWGGAQFGASENGLLVHMRGSGAARTTLNWRGRDGTLLSTVGDPSGYWEPRPSHDGTRIAVSVGTDVGDIWIYHVDQDLRTRFSFDAADDRTPVWSPDDSQVAFATTRESEGEIYVRAVSGEGDARLLFTANRQIRLTDWSSDGRLIFFDHINPDEGGSEIWAVDVQTAEARSVVTGGWLQGASLSPDGKWIAFTLDPTNQSGSEVYVQPFPTGTGRWMVSSDAGSSPAKAPMWRADGRELYYIRGGSIMAVPITSGTTFSCGQPKILFSVSVTGDVSFSMSGDGQRVLTNELPPVDPRKAGASLVQNWMTRLAR